MLTKTMPLTSSATPLKPSEPLASSTTSSTRRLPTGAPVGWVDKLIEGLHKQAANPPKTP